MDEQVHVVALAVPAQHRSVFRNWDLRKIVYPQLRARGLSSQTAQHVVKKVADAYTTRAANAKAGHYGAEDSARYRRIMSGPVAFRPDAAQADDDRILSWDHQGRTVSIWTLNASGHGIPFGKTFRDEFARWGTPGSDADAVNKIVDGIGESVSDKPGDQ